jgi:anti-sigma regulatory factor (Ser/Thr protein kinase)
MPVDGHLLLPPIPAAVRDARHYTNAWFDERRLPNVGDAEVVVSELVTNALRHAATSAELLLRQGDGRIRIEVRDADEAAPAPRDAGAEAADGRGLRLVAALTDRWGWTVTHTGKIVWCEIDLTG